MGFYYSNCGRYITSTFTAPPQTLLIQKGLRDNAAIIIQRWWRKCNVYNTVYDSDIETSSSNNSSLSNLVRRRLKRRRTDSYSDLDSDNKYDGDDDTTILDTNVKQITVNNNFVWDFILSFYTFILSLIGNKRT